MKPNNKLSHYIMSVIGFSSADPPTCPVDEEPTCAVRCDSSVNEPICADGWNENSHTFANMCELNSYYCNCPSYRKVFVIF